MDLSIISLPFFARKRRRDKSHGDKNAPERFTQKPTIVALIWLLRFSSDTASRNG